MVEWPTIAATGLGRFLGRLYGIQAGFGMFRLGRLFMGLTIPVALLLYFAMLAPWSVRRYRLTNRRLIIESGPRFRVDQYVDLDRFDAIDIVVRPGQEWYPAGDLVFRLGQIETLRLAGIGRPDVFRAVCLKANQAYVGVRKAMAAAS